MKSPFGNTIKSYNLERTICDIVKNKNKCGLDIEQRNKVIRKAFSDNEMFERFLERLSKSEYNEKFIIKGRIFIIFYNGN